MHGPPSLTKSFQFHGLQLKSDVFRIAACENLRCGEMDIMTMTGNLEEISKEGEMEMVNALLQYVKDTHRFFS